MFVYKTFAIIITLLKVYFFILILSTLILITLNKKKLTQSVFSQKIKNNNIYYPTDFIKDTPHIINWTLVKLYNPHTIILYILALFMCLLVKILQRLISILIFPIFFFNFAAKIYYKKEIIYVLNIKHNPTLLQTLKLLFIDTPLSGNHRLLYIITKSLYIKIDKQKKTKILIIAYNYAIISFLGFPTWFIDVVNRTERQLYKIWHIDLTGKKKKFFIYRTLTYVGISNIITENENSFINTARKLKILFIDGKIKFNPPKNSDKKLILDTLKKASANLDAIVYDDTVSIKSISNRGEKNHPAIVDEDATEEFKTYFLKTHWPLKSQNFFKNHNNSHTVYNDVQNHSTIDKGFIHPYKPSSSEIKLEKMRGNLYRYTDSNAGINHQTGKNETCHTKIGEFFHENLLKIAQNPTDKEFLNKKIKEINEEIYTSSSNLETIQQKLNNLEIKNHTIPWSNFNGNHTSVRNDINNINIENAIAEYKQEYTLTEEDQNYFIENEKLNSEYQIEKLNSPSKGKHGWDADSGN